MIPTYYIHLLRYQGQMSTISTIVRMVSWITQTKVSPPLWEYKACTTRVLIRKFYCALCICDVTLHISVATHAEQSFLFFPWNSGRISVGTLPTGKFETMRSFFGYFHSLIRDMAVSLWLQRDINDNCTIRVNNCSIRIFQSFATRHVQKG